MLVAAAEMILTLPAVASHQLVGTAVKLMVAVLHHLAMLVAVVLHQLVVLWVLVLSELCSAKARIC